MAIEWCGIIAFIHETWSTVAWLRTSHSALNRTWSSRYVFRYMSPNMTRVDVAIMAANLA